MYVSRSDILVNIKVFSSIRTGRDGLKKSCFLDFRQSIVPTILLLNIFDFRLILNTAFCIGYKY